MKRFLLTLAVLAITATSFAQQTYQPVPMLSKENHWREAYAELFPYGYNIDTGDVYYSDVYLSGDSITLDSTTYKILVYKYSRTGDSSTVGIREDSLGRVFMWRYQQSDRKLYDFTLQKGDTTWKENRGEGSYVAELVHAVDTLQIAGKLRKKITFALLTVHRYRSNDRWDTLVDYTPYSDDSPEKIWIEGIGSCGGLVYPYVMDTGYLDELRVLCNFHDDSSSFNFGPFDCFPTSSLITTDAPPRITAYPNPAKERVTLEFGEARFSTLRLVNTAGATVLETTLTGKEPQHTLQLKGLPSGIYSCILSGKDGTATEKIVVE